jgi:phospholipase A1/A2
MCSRSFLAAANAGLAAVLLLAGPTWAAEAAPAVTPAASSPNDGLPSPPSAEEAQASLFQRRTASELRAMGEPFALLPHRPNWLLPLSYHRRAVASPLAPQALEAQFQISFKFLVARPWFEGRVIPLFGYTGRAWWQVYDGRRSRPFREYDHEPELMLVMPGAGTQVLGWQHRLTTVALIHQSNGRSVPESRSWNRLSAELHADRGQHTWAALKVWRRFKESAKQQPSDSEGDDNPDITRFMGDFELKLGHAKPGGNNFTATLRHSLRSNGRGALQLDWSHPSGFSPSLRRYVHVFSGYGDSLIDYNTKVQRIGVGIMLNDWF